MVLPVEVLLICYYFPPLGGAGVQRSAKFVRYLPDHGFRPIVVAGPEEGRGEWEPGDPGFLDELPPQLPVFRPATAAPSGPRELLPRLFGSPDRQDRWWSAAVLASGREALARHAPGLIFVSLSPFSGFEPALQLAREAGLPLVVDLRDPWVLDEVQIYGTGWHRRRALARMGRLLRQAQGIVMNTPEALAAARAAFPALDPARLRVIPNGYDAEDFAGLVPRAPDGRLRIVHSGYLHSSRALALDRRRSSWRRHLGGLLVELDFHGRSLRYLLEALARLEPAQRERIELELLGQLSAEDQAAIDASPARACVRARGYLSHSATVAALARADLLFLPLHALPPGFRARIVPGKTYEYLASGRPILAALPEGDARDFVAAAEAGTLVAPDDVAGMARALERALAQLPESGPTAPPTAPPTALPSAPSLAPAPAPRELPPAVTRFERRLLTAELAGFFRELL